MRDFSRIQHLMARSQQHFFSMLRVMDRKTNLQARAQICAQAAIFAANNPCGILYSHEIEGELLHLAQAIPPAAECEVIPHSFLHVLTRTYTSGGHTRVCERWIDASPSHQRHDVVLLSQGERDVPGSLNLAAQKKYGCVVKLDQGFACEKAAQLRALASSYEAIILHVHAYDIVPMLAFGHHDFPRPIILYNHGDHLFWVGSSLADLVVNHRSLVLSLNKEARNIDAQCVLPLPLTQPHGQQMTLPERLALKSELGFAPNSRVILTIASSYKFIPAPGVDFVVAAKAILAQDSGAVFLVIGPSPEEPYWRDAARDTGGRIRAIGGVPTHVLGRYLQLADLALESFPLGSTTALMEIAKHNTPCVALASPINGNDAFDEAGIACPDVAGVVARVVSLLQHPPTNNPLYHVLQRDSLPEGFARHLEQLYAAMPKHHTSRVPTVRRERLPTAFEYAIAQNSYAAHETIKRRVKQWIRRSVDCYVLWFYPMGMPRALYRQLNSFGLV